MDWIASIALSFELSEGRGVLVLADHARDCHMAALLRALSRSIPDISVCLSPVDLARLPECATVIYRPEPEHAPVLNRLRPFFAQQKLRVVLWCSDATTFALMRGAPDFFDWISRRDEVPDALPPFAVASVKLAATAVPGIVWRGPGPLEGVLAAAGESVGARLTLGADLAPLIDALRATPVEQWVLVDGIEGNNAMFDLRCATAIAGRTGRVAVMGSDGAREGWWTQHRSEYDAPPIAPDAMSAVVGWPLLDDRDVTLPALVTTLRARVTNASAILAAALAGESDAAELVAELNERGVTLDEVLCMALATDDPGVALGVALIERTPELFELNPQAGSFCVELFELGTSALRRALWQRPERVAWQEQLRMQVLRNLRSEQLSQGLLETWWASRNRWYATTRLLSGKLDLGRALSEALLRGRPEDVPMFGRRFPFTARLTRYFEQQAQGKESPLAVLQQADLEFDADKFSQALRTYQFGRSLPEELAAPQTLMRLRAGVVRTLTTLGRYQDALTVTQITRPAPRSIVALERLRALVRSGRVDKARAQGRRFERELRYTGAAWSTAEMEYDLLVGRWDRPWMNVTLSGAGPGDFDLFVVLGVERQLLASAPDATAKECARLLALLTPGSLLHARVEHFLARALIPIGRYADAENALVRVLPALGGILGDRHHYVGQTLVTRAELRSRGGRYNEAARDLSAAIEIYSETLDADHPDRLVADFALATLPDRRDLPAARKAVAALQRKLGADHPLVRRLDLELSPLVRLQSPRTRR